MKKLLMFALLHIAFCIILLMPPICSWADYHLTYQDDGQGGVYSHFWKTEHGKVTFTNDEHLDAAMWQECQRYQKTGKLLPEPFLLSSNQFAAMRPLYTVCEQARAVPVQEASEEIQKQKQAEEQAATDAFADALLQELRDWTASEYFRDLWKGNGANVREEEKYRHTYGDHWLKLKYKERVRWYAYLHPKLDFGEIQDSMYKAYVKAENERQEDIAARNAMNNN